MKRIENERTAEKKIILSKTTTESDDQVMDQNNGLEAKTFGDKTTTTLTVDL